jgi:hypothetical protein
VNDRGLTVGRLVYLGWYAPRGFVRRCIHQGPVNLWLSGKGRRAMEDAVRRLPSLSTPREDAPTVFFLTGSGFWYQTAFCAYTLLVQAAQSLRVTIIDDETLTADQAAELKRIFPGVRLIWAMESNQRLDVHLPADRFPSLRGRRLMYPHLRKLTDVHVGQSGWKLVLDSDMLFHRRPTFLLDWLEAPDGRPLHMVDIEDAYGYSFQLMTKLANASIPRRVNVGACGLRSDAIDWDRLEKWCLTMLQCEGSHYLQEQAMVAMLMAGQPRAAAPPDQYIVAPSRIEAEHPTAALHHYVADSKAWYFRFGWQEIFAEPRNLGGQLKHD